VKEIERYIDRLEKTSKTEGASILKRYIDRISPKRMEHISSVPEPVLTNQIHYTNT